MKVIPALESGRLPIGIHQAGLEEIVSVFCRGSQRRIELEEPLRILVQTAIDAQAHALYLNGSFVTEKENPGDIDAVVVLPDHFDTQSPQAQQFRFLHRTYGLDIERVAASDLEEKAYLLNDFFGTDRDGNKRGLLEVAL